MRRIDVPALGVFLILLASYAFFWHSRDWNTSSRLMLTYALVDRGTVAIDGLENQTGDVARHRGHYYTDKLPGYPMLATAPYALLRRAFGSPPHPLRVPAMKYWPADYWVTLSTSGLLTAAIGAMLVRLTRDLGGTPLAAILVGLAYGLATPAYPYATLAYGHQASAFALLSAFLLIRKPGAARLAAAGFLSAWASVIELQVGPVSSILGLYLIVEVLRRRGPARWVLAFAAGAAVPTLVLLAYNDAAFGSPWDMGYFHDVYFHHVHTKANPLGLLAPDWSRLGPLLVGRYRGLLAYAPILVLAPPGWAILLYRRRWAMAIVSMLVCAAVLLVNLSYPEWTGGWSTGPRLLVPLLPFAMIPVAGLLAERGRAGRVFLIVAAMLTIVGGVEMLLFQGAGARIPHAARYPGSRADVPIAEPLRDVVWPIWTGKTPPSDLDGFGRNLVSLAAPKWVEALPPGRRFFQMLPLVAGQVLAILALAMACRPRAGRSDLRVDQEQDRGGGDQQAHDPEAES